MSPIRPENRGRYPADWDAISLARKQAAGWRCECAGECGRAAVHLAGDGRCRNAQGEPAFVTGSSVVLTTAHLNHRPEDCTPGNLRAMCQGCHLNYDGQHHAETRAATRAAALADQMEALPGLSVAATDEGMYR